MANSQQFAVLVIERREILLSFGRPVDWLIGVCLVAAATGLVMGVRRLWPRPPAGMWLDKLFLPRSMLVVLACEMGALAGAIGLALVSLFIL